VSVIIRLPFFKTFSLVSFDGTYYLNQARTLFTAAPPSGNFPVGYPFFVAIVDVVTRNTVLAGQLVSLAAGVGSVLLVYALAKRFMSREVAFIAALVLSTLPLFMRVSLATFSESLYTCWVLAGLLLFSKKKYLFAGLALGVASVTRPEVLGIVLPLALIQLKRPRSAATLVIVFIAVYSINTITTAAWHGRLELLPKSKFFGSSVEKDWQSKESTVGDDVKDDAVAAESTDMGAVVTDYARRLPVEIGVLARQVGFIALLLAFIGMVRRPTPLLAGLVPLLAVPLFTVRSEARYLLPYVPIIVVYAFVAVADLKQVSLRKAGFALLALSVFVGFVANRDQVTAAVDEGHEDLRKAGLELKPLIEEGAVIADRKPYLPFYAGGRYLEIPEGSYEDIMHYLVENDVDYLSLHLMVVAKFRHYLWPLIAEDAVMIGEMRFEPLQSIDNKILIYKRVRDEDPLVWTKLTNPTRGGDASPEWSPDGSRLAFASTRRGDSDLYIIPAAGGSPALLVGWPGSQDHPSWSPDGNAIAFTSEWRGQDEIHVIELDTKRTRRVVGKGTAPSWSPDGGSLVYHIDGELGPDLVVEDLASGEVSRLSHNGNNRYPVFSAYENVIAWVREREVLATFHLESKKPVRAAAPSQVGFRPSWSPDGRFLAVTARDWGSTDVYIVLATGTRALLLTKNEGFDGYPAWSPNGKQIAVVSARDGSMAVWLVSGLDPYLDRLLKPQTIRALPGAQILGQN
jgi:hypothetical protein